MKRKPQLKTLPSDGDVTHSDRMETLAMHRAHDPLSLQQREAIDAVCDDFEVQLREGHRPRAEDFLAANPEAGAPLLVELLRVELELRRDAGEVLTAEQYHSRFPQFAGLIDSLFAPADTASDGSARVSQVTQLPGFEVLGVLGRGGMGVVYKARQQRLGRIVALKMVLSGELATPEQRRRFLAEAMAAARVSHPNVVAVHEVGEHQGMPFLAMECVEGGTLADRLAQGPLAPADAARCLRVLADAVQAAHTAGVVHRDLKPANVLLSRDSTPKITDFGLARLDDGHGTRTGQFIGTPAYMSPEQARGEKAGPAADIYALGAILYEAISCRPPFQAAQVHGTLELIRNSDPVPLRTLQPGTPRDLETICLKCLEKDPKRRYRSATELAGRLDLFLAGRPIPDRAYGPVERAWRLVKRRPIESALGVVLAASVVLALAWGWRENAHAQAQARATRFQADRDAARALARRGDWNRSVEFYDRAIASADSQAASLTIERQRLLLVLGRRDEFDRNMAWLEEHASGADLELLRADLDFADGRDDMARERLRTALASGELSPADTAFARALLAATPKATADLLATALRHDPDHFRASSVLAQVHVVAASPEPAREQIVYHQRKFPDDPAGPFLQAWADARAGRDAGKVQGAAGEFVRAEAEFQDAFAQAASEQRHGATLAALERLSTQPPSLQRNLMRLRLQFWDAAAFSLSKTRPPDGRHLGLLVARLPWMQERTDILRAAVTEAQAGRPRQAAERITAAIERFPEAMLFYARSNFRTMQAAQHHREYPKDVPGMLNLFCDSADDAERAILAPAERPIFRRAAMKDLAVIDSWLFHCMEDDLAPDWLSARIERNQKRLLFEAPLTREEHQRVTGLMARDHYKMRPAWVCPLLRDWRAKDAQNVRVVRLLVAWEIRARNFAAALEVADEGLKSWKVDAALIALRKKAADDARTHFR